MTPSASNPELLFTSLPLRQELYNSLDNMKYESMTLIQAQSLPEILNKKDLIAKAQTGSGKTAAFSLGLLNDLKIAFFGAQGLVLCPTRELAEQVSQAIRKLACFIPNVKIVNLSGGMPMRAQLDSLRHGAHIIVGTPGRILKHLKNKSLDLTQLRTLVLDEADRMLDMGFLDDITQIISCCPKSRQTLLFSATYTDDVVQLSKQFLKQPKEITVENALTELDIEQCFYEVSKQAQKYTLLKSLLLDLKLTSTLIFCNTKQQTQDVVDFLIHDGFSALALNGDMEQMDRDLAVLRFTNLSCSILVATDVAARGLDIKELPAVINFDLAFELETHIHRIGRTGRAGKKGIAVSITTPTDAQRIGLIEENQKHPVSWAKTDELKINKSMPLVPEMVTLGISSGKKDKIRPGDILGALTKEAGLTADTIGKIYITATYSYVAIHRAQAQKAMDYLKCGKMKGRKVNVFAIN